MSTNGEKLFGINKLELSVIFQRDIDNREKGGIKWRHKILDALQNMANEVELDGIIEVD